MQPGATEPKPVPAYDRHSGGWREGQPLPRQGAHTTHPPTPTPRAHLRGRGSPGVARARRSVACRSRPQRGWTRGSAVPAGVWGQSRRWPKSRRPGRMGAGANGVEGGDRQRRCGIHTVGGGGRGVLVPAKPSFVWTTAGEAGDLEPCTAVRSGPRSACGAHDAWSNTGRNGRDHGRSTVLGTVEPGFVTADACPQVQWHRGQPSPNKFWNLDAMI